MTRSHAVERRRGQRRQLGGRHLRGMRDQRRAATGAKRSSSAFQLAISEAGTTSRLRRSAVSPRSRLQQRAAARSPGSSCRAPCRRPGRRRGRAATRNRSQRTPTCWYGRSVGAQSAPGSARRQRRPGRAARRASPRARRRPSTRDHSRAASRRRGRRRRSSAAPASSRIAFEEREPVRAPAARTCSQWSSTSAQLLAVDLHPLARAAAPARPATPASCAHLGFGERARRRARRRPRSRAARPCRAPLGCLLADA